MSAIEGLRGAAIVTRAGSVELEVADGPADTETGAACTPETRFQIASISKQFAAAAVMLLAEAGRVALDEPVDRWFPGCPAQWRQVTLHQVLTHTAGIRHWDPGVPGLDPSQPLPADERLAFLLKAPLVSEPGAQWLYSSPGYLLAGQIVERASGRNYADFVTERILTPLGMTATVAGAPPDSPGLARGHRDGVPAKPFDLSTMPGAGDICATAADVARFTTALYSGALLAPDSLRTMRTAHAATRDASDDGWLVTDGYGYAIFTGAVAGRPLCLHPGDNPGYRSLAVWLPDASTSVVILANDETCELESLLRQLLPAFAGPDPAVGGRRGTR